MFTLRVGWVSAPNDRVYVQQSRAGRRLIQTAEMDHQQLCGVHEESDSHVVGDKLADGNSEDESTRPTLVSQTVFAVDHLLVLFDHE